MAWTKLHTDILGDPKLLRAARKGAKQLLVLPWLLAFAKQADDEGRLTISGQPAEPEDIAPLLPGVSPRQIERALIELEEIGVLIRDDRILFFAAWERRAGEKPSDSKEAISERVKRHRERQRNALHETLHETPSNATEKKREEERRGEESVTALHATFQSAWSEYPKRAGGNPRRSAEKAWGARVREGADPSAMLDGVRRYRAYCERTGRIGGDYVLQAATFFGPDRRYEEAWDAPADPLELRAAQLREAQDAEEASWNNGRHQ